MKFFCLPTEKNGLSFIETSALDSTNVEAAFQTILTGKTCMFRLYQWEIKLLGRLFIYLFLEREREKRRFVFPRIYAFTG